MTLATGSERRLILPDDPAIKLVYGSDSPGRRAYLLRLRRAVKRGLLPQPTYLSAQRFGWWSDELEAAFKRLPTSYAALPPVPLAVGPSSGQGLPLDSAE